jgi:hypothetical protein
MNFKVVYVPSISSAIYNFMSKIIACITQTKKHSLIPRSSRFSKRSYSYESFFFLRPICFFRSLILKCESLLVVEPDYLPNSEVLCFSAVFIPHKYVHSSTWWSAKGGYPLCGVQGVYSPGWGVQGRSPRRKNCLVNVYCNFIVNLDRSL